LKLKLKMNTRKLLIILGVTATATVNLMATDAYLSPRAAGNQINIVSGTNTDPNLAAVSRGAVSPRLAESQIQVVAGKDATLNPSRLCTLEMTGSPKDIAACAAHPGAAMPCCAIAATK
jgi:hypothetical protein